MRALGVISVLLLLLVAGCAAGDSGSPGGEQAGDAETTFIAPSLREGGDAQPETERKRRGEGTRKEEGVLRVEQVAAGSYGQGMHRPRVVIAPSAEALSAATGIQIPDSGGGTYVAALWGRKNTGGYNISIRSARIEGNLVTLRLVLEKPPPDAIVTQAITYPYAVAVARGLDPRGKEFVLVDQDGRHLDWPVQPVGS